MIRPVVVSFVCSGDNGLGLNHSRWFEGNCCRLPNASGDCWQLREPRTQMGNWCEYQVTLDWTEADDTYGGTVFGENADRQERTETLADKNGEFAFCRHETILSNWYFTERLSEEDFFGNWQLLSNIFSWFRIQIKINKRPKNLTCCVAEVDIVWRLLCKMTLILVSTFEFVCIYINKMIWFLKYFGIDIFTWMKTGPEVSLEACPLWTKRKAKSRRLIPPPSWPPPPPPSWRGALPAALPPAPIMKLLTTPRLTCGRHWDQILKTMSHYHKIKTSLLRMITTKCYANAR